MMSLVARWSIAASSGAVIAILLSAAAPRPVLADEARANNTEQIGQWIRQLDADVFVDRELATQHLVDAGADAVPALQKATEGGNLEVTTRAVFILRQLALSGDVAAEDAALAALQQLATSEGSAAQRRAAASLAVLDEVRQERAIERLQRLGARVSTWNGFVGGQFVTEMVSMEIGEDWEGDIQDLRELRWLRDFDRLVFMGERVTDQWIEPIQQLSGLRSIHINSTKVTEAATVFLEKLQRLQEIKLWYSPIGDGAIEHLQVHRNAQNIELYGTQISREAAEQLQNLLGVVDYREGGFLGVGCTPHPLGCVVSVVHEGSGADEAGVRENDVILRYKGEQTEDFEALRKLISSDPVGTRVAMQILRGGEDLAKSFQYDPERPLGLTGTEHPLGCEVKEVAEGSLLDHLRVRPGDVIARYNTDRIGSPEQLQQLYQQSRLGQHVTLQVRRGGRIFETTATLGQSPPDA